MIGSSLGPYKSLEKIGAGGMGESFSTARGRNFSATALVKSL
jgi:hypothetical protein